MKTMRKVFALLMALSMILALAISANAADGKTTVTINSSNNETGSAYTGYKLLNAIPAVGEDGKPIQKDGKDLYTYSVNAAYADVLKEVTGFETDSDIYNYIAKQDAAVFADKVYEKLAGVAGVPLQEGANEIDQGYWLIVETTAGQTADGSAGTISRAMMDTAGVDALTISTKEDITSGDKEITTINDEEQGDNTDAASVKVGDKIGYKLTADLDAKHGDYDEYFLQFGDTMVEGLKLVDDSIVIKFDGTPLSEREAAKYIQNATDTAFDVIFENLKEAEGYSANLKEVTVEYLVEVTEDAVKGGLNNTFTLQYSRDPYDPSQHGSSTTHTSTVYTYQLTVGKVDGANNALAGAGFTLTGPNGYTKEIAAADGLTSFVFSGLTAGDYKLEETTVPEGYNKANDIEFTITPTYNGDKLTNLDVTCTSDDQLVINSNATSCELAFNVVNQQGVELPSTGGIGTTIFTVVGATLMIGAAVLFITKKRSVN